jgi:hypothetical protein
MNFKFSNLTPHQQEEVELLGRVHSRKIIHRGIRLDMGRKAGGKEKRKKGEEEDEFVFEDVNFQMLFKKHLQLLEAHVEMYVRPVLPGFFLFFEGEIIWRRD